VLMASRSRRVRREPHDLTDRELLGRVYRLAWCTSSVLDPDDWFPVAQQAAKAQDQAARAIAVCARCPVRPDCAGGPLAWMTTASICCCSLLWECWVPVGMFRSFRCFFT
jgi:Transcription factor WhiB